MKAIAAKAKLRDLSTRTIIWGKGASAKLAVAENVLEENVIEVKKEPAKILVKKGEEKLNTIAAIPSFSAPKNEVSDIVCGILAGDKHDIKDIKSEFKNANPSVKIGSILGLLANGKDLSSMLSSQKISSKIQARITKSNNNPTDAKLLNVAKKLRDLSMLSEF